MRVLPPGADVTFSEPGKGIADSAEFTRAQDREIAAGLGIPYSVLTGDLGEANYSSERVGVLEFRRRAKAHQRILIEDGILRPLWRRWVAGLELSGRVIFATDADRGVRFVAPGWQWVDPESEVKAEVEAIRAGLKSRAEVVASRGRDLDELDEELAADTWRPEAPGGAMQ
jgi:lambda family phage portal protein